MPHQPEPVRRMRQSRVAHRFGEKRCWQLAFVLRGFFFEAKLWDPWISTHRRARESAARLDDRWALAGTNSHLGVALADRGDLAGAAECYRNAPELYRELGDEPGEITVRANRGWVEHYRGEHDSALRNLSAALEHYEGDGNTRTPRSHGGGSPWRSPRWNGSRRRSRPLSGRWRRPRNPTSKRMRCAR